MANNTASVNEAQKEKDSSYDDQLFCKMLKLFHSKNRLVVLSKPYLPLFITMIFG